MRTIQEIEVWIKTNYISLPSNVSEWAISLQKYAAAETEHIHTELDWRIKNNGQITSQYSATIDDHNKEINTLKEQLDMVLNRALELMKKHEPEQFEKNREFIKRIL